MSRSRWFHHLPALCQLLLVAASALLIILGPSSRSRAETQPPGPAALAALRPGEWYEVPNSRMRTVCPAEAGRACRHVMAAWSGGAYDTKRNRLVIWGGGHADYWGNEVYVFDVTALRWSRLNEPYRPAASLTAEETVSVYSDGSPASRHTYDSIEYLPTQDRLWINGGSRWKSGAGDAYTGWFDFDRLAWERKADSPARILAGASAYDPVRDRIYQYDRGRFLEYDPGADQWIVRGRDPWESNFVGEIDPVTRHFVILGRGRAFTYALRDTGPVRRQPLNAVGDLEIQSALAPGFAYHPRTQRIVAWAGGPDVYTLDVGVTPPRWTRVSPAPTNTVVPTDGGRAGTYGRWRYIPAHDVFVGVNAIDENVYFYRVP